MILEEGKFYRDGLGDVHGPMKIVAKILGGNIYPFEDTMTGQSYTKDGSFIAGESSARDLIEEVPGKVVTLYCGKDREDLEWYACEIPVPTDTLKITFHEIAGKADPSSVRMELI